MASSPKLYTRLTRNSFGVGTSASLWIAGDHLMIVESSGYHETYSRLELSELKAIFLVSTDRRMLWGVILAVLFAISALIFLSTLFSRGTPIFSVVFLVIGGGGLLWNYLLGEGCRAYVLTGVQTVTLPGLVRIKQARRMLARLQPLIAQAQAQLPGALPPATLRSETTAEPPPFPGRPAAVPVAIEPPAAPPPVG